MDLEEVTSFEEFKILQTEATQLMADINVAKSFSLERRLILCAADPVTLPPSGITFSVSNCTKSWILSADRPFVNIDLVAAAITWTTKQRENICVLSMSLYRFLLKMITEPPVRVKEYAVRINGRSGRDDNLKNLPGEVENTLINFGEDMLGLGRDELQVGAVFDRTTSRFFLGLGKTDDERTTMYESLVTERITWRKQLLKALQRALSDVRADKNWPDKM
ncbi:unnamed protein product [Heligmosomoides polygyrus]|uniref:Crinkler (CRN) family protein n=1 Tax=Heligmosomoides polygyrus TaxID=6339 RepID=A0A183GFI2_HELPZ|nr:unnamed protein product [Heligmosomoides polygyrus]